MNIKVPKEVEELSEIFESKKIPLYIVGGYVRNQLQGIFNETDIDLCSKATPEQVQKLLKNSGFEIRIKGQSTGVLEISKNGKIFDHATFRKEFYDIPGVHTPNEVKFTDKLIEDADRRDFTINSIYYDISSGNIIDPFDGIKDLNKKVVRTIFKPEIVFKNDGIRIMRMARIAATLGFDIEEKTFEAAKNNAYKLQYISKSLIKEEFSRIVQADIEYPTLSTDYAHVRGLKFLINLDALKYVMPELEILKRCNQKFVRKTSLFDYALTVFSISEPEIRLSALLFLIGAAKLVDENKSIKGHEKLASEMSEQILGENGIGYSKEIVERVKKIILKQNFGNKFFVSKNEIKFFIAENLSVIDYIVMLKNAIARVNSMNKKRSTLALRMKTIYNKMKVQKTPFFISDLKVGGVDILNAIPDINEKYISKLLKHLLFDCIKKPEMNNKTWLLIQAKKLVSKNTYYKI